MAEPGCTLEQLGEDRVIAFFTEPSSSVDPELLVPNGDDAAAFKTAPHMASVVTTDALVEEVHFSLHYSSPYQVGKKLVSVNLSDVASMGAKPRYVLLTLSFPKKTAVSVAEAIGAGIRAQARRFGVTIIGGNISASPGPIVLSATLIGESRPEHLVQRRGSSVGDGIYVTGQLGSAQAGLRILQSKAGNYSEVDEPLIQAQISPEPRVETGFALGQTGLIHSMCDVSDGFGQDLARLLSPEGLGASIEASALPITHELKDYCARSGSSAVDFALAGGEDYELVFTARPEHEPALMKACARADTALTRVGHVIDGTTWKLISEGAERGFPKGFDHFA